MKKRILYLLRKPVDLIDPSLFLASESDGDVVLLNDSGGAVFTHIGDRTHHQRSYDALIKKIFECDRTIVI